MIKQASKQPEFEFVYIDQLVPEDHLVRKIDEHIRFDFIREKVAHLYCHTNGRPGVDPVVLFKMLFIGYLFGIRSERQLVKDIYTNVAYRWFLGYKLTDKIPHHSTISKNRTRRFADSTICQEIFDEIVIQAIEHGLISAEAFYSDSTHLQANANKNKYDKKAVEKSTRDYIDDLNRDVTEDREAHGKKPLKEREEVPEVKEIKVSTTDPDSGYMVRDGKPKGFFYLDHRTVDGQFNIIIDTYVTPGNVHDSIPYLSRLDRICSRFELFPRAVGLDAGYFTAPLCRGLVERDIFGVISYRRPNHIKGMFRKREFTYNTQEDTYSCPLGETLNYRTTGREGYRMYASEGSKCIHCPALKQCTRSQNHTKVVTRHVWEEYKEQITANRLSDEGKLIYKKRKETVERSFANAKQLHGHRYARLRGQKKVTEQCLLAAACQNMKKIALLLSRRGKGGGNSDWYRLKTLKTVCLELYKAIFSYAWLTSEKTGSIPFQSDFYLTTA